LNQILAKIVYFGKKVKRIKIKKNSKTVREFSQDENSIDIGIGAFLQKKLYENPYITLYDRPTI
jgi:hypothetical protein